MTVCTRFAPSPTGDLHIGSVRTALYCWLYAKRHQGHYIFRIEDTDLARSTPEAVRVIIDGLGWLGLTADEPPIFQTKRFDRYREVIDAWLAKGIAYRCYCSTERLAAMRETQLANKAKPRYDRYCLQHQPSDPALPYVVRFKNPSDGQVVVHDAVLGDVVFDNQELDDLIIARSDGTPTYNFTVVVDDHDMKITHVIRGNDHLNNTPRQINMLAAMGAPLPIYAHIPMILGEDGKKLSKRHGAASVLEYQTMGFLPVAIINYLARLGWSHGDQEIFSIDELIQHFDIYDVHKSPSAFDMEKLRWLNQHYLKTLPPSEVIPYLQVHMQALNLDVTKGPALELLIATYAERVHTLLTLAERARPYYQNDITIDASLLAKHVNAEAKQALEVLSVKLTALTVWDLPSLQTALDATLADTGIKLGVWGPALRVALLGDAASPPLAQTLMLMGREKSLSRLAAVY